MAGNHPDGRSLDEKIAEFIGLTAGTATAEEATHFLELAQSDVSEALALYFDTKEETAENDSEDEAEDPSHGYQGPRTLDGRPAPQAASSSAPTQPLQKRKGLATLSSLGGPHENHGDDDDDDDSDFDESKGPRDLFAGGEKSGLAVQDPAQSSRKVMKDILAKAKSRDSRPESDSEAGPSRRFRGTGQTLGGEGAESRTIPDPLGEAIPPVSSRGPPQERTLHIWEDGFSIDDGELHRFDDPQNAADLQMIRQGRAPLHLMNVRYDEPLDVKLQQHKEEYRQLPKIYRAFGGEGRRLGSPVPGDASQVITPLSATATPATPSQQVGSTTVDESQPTLMLRVQLPDGTRLPARFNTTATIDDVYKFVQGASPSTQNRPWVLATTFPSKEHTDRDLVLGEMAEFKRGGNVQVKWT